MHLSAQSETARTIHERLDELMELLKSISEDLAMNAKAISDAAQLLSSILNFNFIVLQEFWSTILGKIDRI